MGWGVLEEGEGVVERRAGPVLGSRGAELRRWTISVMDLMVPFLLVVFCVSWDQLGVLTGLWKSRVRTS